MRPTGVEPAHLAILEPESSASANSATAAGHSAGVAGGVQGEDRRGDGGVKGRVGTGHGAKGKGVWGWA